MTVTDQDTDQPAPASPDRQKLLREVQLLRQRLARLEASGGSGSPDPEALQRSEAQFTRIFQ